MKETPKDTTSTTGTTASKAPSAKKAAVKKAPAKKKAAIKKSSVKKAPAKKQATKNSDDTIKAVFVKTNPGIKSFRRAGFGFHEAGYGIALDVLKKAQLKQLEDEPNLIVEHCTLSADQVKVK